MTGPGAPRPAAARPTGSPRGGRLSPGLRAFIAVDVVLVLTLLVLVIGAITRGGGEPEASDTSSATPDVTATETTPVPEETAQAPEGALELTTFTLPSRNITCTIEPDAARCAIVSFTYTPPEVSGCEGTVGHVIEVTAEAASFPCVPGDPPQAAADEVAVLAYGEETWAHGFLCSSSTNGVVCRNDDGAGFTMARAGYDLLS